MNKADMAKLGKGLLLLIIVILIGVSAAENQLNRLTRQQEFVQVFSVQRDFSGQYTAYLLGHAVQVQAVYKIASITPDHELIIGSGQERWTIPTKIRMDYQQYRSQASDYFRSVFDKTLQLKQTVQQKLEYYVEYCLHLYEVKFGQ